MHGRAIHSAMDCLVPVIADFAVRDSADLFGAVVGPLQQHRRYEVPLYAALYLHHSQRASLCVPNWLKPEALAQALEAEKRLPGFGEIHPHFIEVSQKLLGAFRESEDLYAEEGMSGAQHLTLISVYRDDLLALRREKLAKLSQGLAASDLALDVTNLTALELAELEPLKRVLGQQARISAVIADLENRA